MLHLFKRARAVRLSVLCALFSLLFALPYTTNTHTLLQTTLSSVTTAQYGEVSVQATNNVINIAAAGMDNDISAFLANQDIAAIQRVSRAFYTAFEDEYDFLYFFPGSALQGDIPTGAFTPVFRPANPAIGLNQAVSSRIGFGASSVLKGVSAYRRSGTTFPLLHETLHYWGIDLLEQFGPYQSSDHWGNSGANGQCGGFDQKSLKCVRTNAAPALFSDPPCPVSSGGRKRTGNSFEVSVDSFNPIANGGDSIPYSPIELYLMGLKTSAQVQPRDITILNQPNCSQTGSTSTTMTFSCSQMATLTIDEIVAKLGENPPATQNSFKAAFVIASDTLQSANQLSEIETVSRIFGARTSSSLYSFQRATSSQAFMNTELSVVPATTGGGTTSASPTAVRSTAAAVLCVVAALLVV